ncbi:MAG TPA: hypothetical protein GX707_03760 [Epulopiscium sp.]|nr:hypothetical protein [Candidatus Epulonipiscium sp.]
MATDKLTCEKIRMNFYNIQPIQIKETALKKVFGARVDLSSLDKVCTNKKPEWLKEFLAVHDIYKSFKLIEVDPISLELLKEDMQHSRYVKNQYPLDKHIIYEEVDYYLMFDFKAMFWILVYEIPVEFAVNELNRYLGVKELQKNMAESKNDLYNVIRDLMVRSYAESNIGKWAVAVEEMVISKVHMILTKIYKLKIERETVYIPFNTGNITNVVCFKNLNKEDYCKYTKLIMELNEFSERINYHMDLIELKDETLYSFNGRFHTIILKGNCSRHRYIPIQFHVQYMFIYLSVLYKLMETLNGEILTSNSGKIITEQNNLIDDIINKTQTICIFNENFKMAIESDNENIYCKIEKYWNLEKSLEGTERYVDNFKNYLDRLYLKMNAKNDNKQNNILFFISMLQLVALMSVWNDYMAIVSIENTDSEGVLVLLFGSVENLQRFNLYLPIFFFGFIGILTLYSVLSKKRF